MALAKSEDDLDARAGRSEAASDRNSIRVAVANPGVLTPSERIFILGEATWLLMHSRHKQRYALFQLAALVTTPITLDQFRIYRNAKGPVGFVSWAWMSDEASDDYANDRRLLAPEDISSGSNLWVIELIAPFGHMRSIARDLRENVFAGKVGRSMSRSENGPPRVVTWDNRRRTGAT